MIPLRSVYIPETLRGVAMPHNTEVGINLLIEQLRRTGHEVKRLGGTFDLDVDGQLAEVKTKTKCFTEMDFISLTQETISLREDNSTYVHAAHLHIDHDQKDHATVNHRCDVDAWCGSCNRLLPWPLYQIRSLDGLLLPTAQIRPRKLSHR
jgi:hypothetical protein